MKAKIICILVMTLLIVTALPVVGMTNINEDFKNISIDESISLKQTIVKSSNMATWSQQTKLTAYDGDVLDYYGSANSIDGDFAVIGAYGDDDNGGESGSVYVYQRSGTTWPLQAKLTAPDGVFGDAFGCSVSIDVDRVIIGAYGDDDNGFYSGSAYVFKNSGTSWFQESKILPADGTLADWFGAVVSISGEYAIIGAPLDDDMGTDSGSAYVYKRSGNSWTQEAKLTALDGASADYFGFCVAIDGEYAVIGAYGDDDKGSESGSAYIFKRSGTTWAQEAKVTATDSAIDDWFGQRVSISDDYAIIGAYKNDDSGSDSGSVYIFKRSGTTWSQEAKLLASDGAADDWFGYSVSIDRDRALIGAQSDDDLGIQSGSAYIFKRSGTTWSQEAKILPADGTAGQYFGSTVSIDGIYSLVGQPRGDGNVVGSGAAYIFIRSNQPPSAPTINGQTNGNVGTSYPYQFTSVDPDGDDIAEYIVNWGDGPDQTVTGPFTSGSPVTESHTWTTKGTYTIRAKARDIYGAEGPEGTFVVTIPRNKVISNPFLNFLQNHPNVLPILQLFLQKLGLH